MTSFNLKCPNCKVQNKYLHLRQIHPTLYERISNNSSLFCFAGMDRIEVERCERNCDVKNEN